MGFFGFLFWLAVFWLAFRAWRRWERWAVMGPRGYGPYGGWNSRDWHGRARENDAPQGRLKQGDQQEYIDALESRVTELEERLDFTERLLAGKRETAS